jgi:ATP-binding cassette, subfamily A (ABC1), member 3
MTRGQMSCCGSSLFLKNRFGIGYNFTLVKQDMADNERINDFIMEKLPLAEKQSDAGKEISYRLPFSTSK